MNSPSVATPPRLHVPDEPTERKLAWHVAVLGGEELEVVVTGPGGLSEWLWGRWRVLAGQGMTPESFTAVVAGYRREVWLWLAGERTWEQCCSGLIGRIARRPAVT